MADVPRPSGRVRVPAPASGHVNPLLPILSELAGRGVDVLSTSIPSLADKLVGTGARLVEYPPFVAERATTPRPTASPASARSSRR